jgi:hypothetical protein
MKETAISINKPVPSPIKKIGNMVCTQMQVFGDLALIWSDTGIIKAFSKQGLLKRQVIDYQIENATVKQVFLPQNYEIIILQTQNRIYLRDYSNKAISDTTAWADFYIDAHTHELYRQNNRGNWFDLEGYKLEAPVFLQETVLVSLVGKKSKNSIVFKDAKLLISPQFELIQIGKIVLDNRLEIIPIFGEKITGLGKKYIQFTNGINIQEVKTGFKTTTFINEKTKAAFLINDEQVIGHRKTILKDHLRFEIFFSKTKEYVLSEDGTIVSCDGEYVKIDFGTYVKLGNRSLVKCRKKSGSQYMDLESQTTFTSAGTNGQRIEDIAQTSFNIAGMQLRNMSTKTKQFVYNETNQSIYTLNAGSIQPNAIKDPVHFSEHFGIAIINGQEKYFNKYSQQTLQLGEDKVEIGAILSNHNAKLLNALSVKGEKLVLDVRQGFDYVKRATSNGQNIAAVESYPKNVGQKMLQNALLNTLGGTEKRVIDLNSEQLAIFTLPDNLMADPANISPSIYQSNPILELDFKNLIKIEDEVFLVGKFLPYHDTPTTVLIQRSNNQPLHLEGASHKNQLVTQFIDSTLKEKFYIGNNRMIGAKSLSEDGKEINILFSFQKKSTWIPFNETALPILNRVIRTNTTGQWSYLLFEILKSEGKEKQYIAVEQKAPHRILVERKKGVENLKILDQKTVLPLRAPTELSNLQKLFIDDPGYLKEL